VKTHSFWKLVLAAVFAGGIANLAVPIHAQEDSAGPDAGPKESILGNRDAKPIGNKPYLFLQQWGNEGYYQAGVDLNDADAVFWHVFAQLPSEVTIYPSENYFYWILYIEGRQVWGNIRLPAGRRERGVLSFGYSEFTEFPSGPGSYLSRSKYFTEGDGLLITEVDKSTYTVRYNKREVTFHLHKLKTEPPKLFTLNTNETFIERTFDESGIQFFLLFNTERNYFFWVLNEEEKVPDVFTSLDKEVMVGRRSGFAFWIDALGRKVLATIRKISVTRNDYYDGPFDQLADNYVDINKISYWMERAIPTIKGRIDKYGYYTDVERPSRVALSCYGTYYTHAEILDFVKKAKASNDPYQYISRGGVPLPGEMGTNYWSSAYGTNWYAAALTNRTNSAWSYPYPGRTNATAVNAAAPVAKPQEKKK
jgi:hypothetical protein